VSRVALRKGDRRWKQQSRFDNKQECEQMKTQGAEGLSATQPVAPAANEEFAGNDNAILDIVTHSRSGWDPYEVWRTRVKATSRIKKERERDSIR
jgi:hypothetical protein